MAWGSRAHQAAQVILLAKLIIKPHNRLLHLLKQASLRFTGQGDTSLKRVDTTTGAILQTIPLSGAIGFPAFDGTNLWIPCTGPDQVFVVRAVGGLTGTVLAELTGNGLDGGGLAAFDGERICVTNSAAQSVSLWKASDLSPLGAFNIWNNLFRWNA
jgi:hypothetical protein